MFQGHAQHSGQAAPRRAGAAFTWRAIQPSFIWLSSRTSLTGDSAKAMIPEDYHGTGEGEGELLNSATR